MFHIVRKLNGRHQTNISGNFSSLRNEPRKHNLSNTTLATYTSSRHANRKKYLAMVPSTFANCCCFPSAAHNIGTAQSNNISCSFCAQLLAQRHSFPNVNGGGCLIFVVNQCANESHSCDCSILTVL